MKDKKGIVFAVVFYIVVVFLAYYIFLPPLNLHAFECWMFLTPCVALAFVLYLIVVTPTHIQPVRVDKTKLSYGFTVIGLMIVTPIALKLISSSVFHASEYANRISLKNVEFTEIEQVDFNKTPIIDRDSTEVLGDRILGEMPEMVSQFDVSDEYTQISYKDSVYRVTPLAYNDFFKYLSNRGNGIPGYITVNSTTGETKLVKLDKLGLGGMKYVPSGMFNEDLMRKLRFDYPFEIFGSPSFEIDEKGNPYYVCTTYTYKWVGSKKSVTGAIFLDPITGKSKKYDVEDIPSWADRIYPESLLVEELDQNGSLQSGFLNSIFGQKGVVVTSEGYNYLEKDGDIWLYSGITSANEDSSNLGYVLVNMRTHEGLKISSPGANEYSAMATAEGEVKNYGYHSTFPLLINVNGKPVYLVSLKDDAGLVKQYGMIDASNYQKVETISADKGLDELIKKFVGNEDDLVNDDELKKETITVSSIQQLMIDGNTKYFITDTNGNKYKITVSSKNEDILAFLKVNDIIEVQYIDGNVRRIKKIK